MASGNYYISQRHKILRFRTVRATPSEYVTSWIIYGSIIHPYSRGGSIVPIVDRFLKIEVERRNHGVENSFISFHFVSFALLLL